MDGIGGVAVEDAGTLYVVRDEDDDADYPVGDEEMLVFKTSLRDLVAGAVDGWQEQDGFTGAAHEAASDALAAALRAAADMLDAAKRPNVAGNRLARQGQSELTGLLGGPARSEKE